MKAIAVPALVFLLLAVGFVVDIVVTSKGLPAKVATHFDAAGKVDGWMPRAEWINFNIWFGLGLAVFVIAVHFSLRFFPDRWMNMQNRDYWLSPAKRADTYNHFMRYGFWFACGLIILFIAIHHVVISANASVPPRLSGGALATSVGLFLTGMTAWVIQFLRYFRKKD